MKIDVNVLDDICCIDCDFFALRTECVFDGCENRISYSCENIEICKEAIKRGSCKHCLQVGLNIGGKYIAATKKDLLKNIEKALEKADDEEITNLSAVFNLFSNGIDENEKAGETNG